jgi:hypothetical protein
MQGILDKRKEANSHILILCSFILGMASFRFLMISCPLENSGSLATAWQPEVSPRTAWEALVARSPEVVTAVRNNGSHSRAARGTLGLQRALL